MVLRSGHPFHYLTWERSSLSDFRVSQALESINNLPEDILITIFKFVLPRVGRDETYRILCRSVESKVETDSLVGLSHVCALWRAILLAYPLFWTRTDGHNSGKLECFIARSQSLPISLFLTSRANDIQTAIRSCDYRMRRLDLTLSPKHIDPCTLSLSNCAMLECVTLNFDYDKRLGEPFFHATPFLLFGEEVLPFKALAITPLSGSFPSNHFPNLTHLWIGLDVRWGEDTINFSSTILDLFSNTPKLQFLAIHGLCGWFDSEPVASQVPVRLDHLRSLVVFDGELSSCVAILSVLSIPHAALIRLHGLNVITAEAPQLGQAGILESVSRLCIRTEGVDLSIVTEGPACAFWLDTYFAEDPFDEPWDAALNWDSWLLELPGWFPLGQVSEVEISVGSRVDIILNLLSLLPKLTDLRVRLPNQDHGLVNSSDHTIACALYTALAQEDPLLCPNLRTFNVEIDVSQANRISTCHSIWLAAMIEARHRHGYPICQVVLQPLHQELAGGQEGVPIFVMTFEHLSGHPSLEVSAPSRSDWPFRREIQSRWFQDDITRYWDID